jgi:predicted TPR repeat methyltransferase
LVGTLKYGIPGEIAALLTGASAAGFNNVLDLGCGTGLMALELAGRTNHIVGVDVSAKMLEKATERNVYARLVRSDLVEMMTAEPASTYDLVVATDVFVYVCKLDASFEQAHRMLRPSGLFAYSVEAMSPGRHHAVTNSGYVLHEHGRYAHAEDYLQRLADRVGFAQLEFRSTVCRENHGVPVPGYVAVLRKA